MNAKTAERLYQIFIYTVVGILVLISLFPLVYVACLSLTSEAEYMARGNLMVVPYHPTLTGYKRILLDTDIYIRGFGVSVARTLVGTMTTLFCTLILGYLLSRKDLPGRKILLIAVMITVLYGGGLIPTFMTVQEVGLLDTFWAMIIPTLVDSWSVLVFKQSFEGLPQEVMESASVDGCGELRMLLRIVLPMSTPVMAALGLFTAVGHWNAWFDAMIYIQKNTDLFPLQLLLRNLLVNASIGYDLNAGIDLERSALQTPTSLRMVVVMIGTIPILCIYPFLQKYFTAGMYVGAVKG
ncbi:MAG TPA: carbohydrate ABC transporter permease [Candidatus Eisenbergiella merdipullorum]|uniref:Carbohydrate ABC transporter permease n=1 Tax=Candidatus Eisenbergiella merdipullorum TaxID=2838553 RepID=A0A9D2L259_9FIRM|nr:carbohydrate ABC transporter permease [Candidatus Eisenbergiella merdipullorum]